MDGGKMTIPTLPPYVPPFQPVPQITPFTYRDGVTYLEKLTGLGNYIDRVIVPFINENFDKLSNDFKEQVNILIIEVNAAILEMEEHVNENLEQQNQQVDQKITDLTTYVNAQVQSIINESIEVQDSVVAGILGNDTSDSRTVTDTLYADKATETEVNTVSETINNGRLSDETLREEFVTRDRGDAVVNDPHKNPTKTASTGTAKVQIPTLDFTVFDSGHEWWCEPVVNAGQLNTYGAGYASNGEVLAWDRNYREGLTSVVVADGGVNGPAGAIDDHNAPARWVSADEKFSVLIWNTHSASNSLYLHVSLDGSARGFNDHDVQPITYTVPVAYNQMYLQGISGDDYRFLILCRAGAKWLARYITVNRVTGVLTQSEPVRDFISINGQQAYVMGVLDGRLIRFSAYVNPSFDTHAIWLMTLHIDSGAMTNYMDSGFTHNLSDGLLELSTLPPLLPEISSSNSRRMYYPHPKLPRVLYSEWARGSEANATYKEAILSGGIVYTRSFGVAGPRNGYTSLSNYNPGMCYDKTGDYVISAHNLTDGTGEIHIHATNKSWITRKTNYPVSRPISVRPNEFTYLAVDNYVDYFTFLVHQVDQVGFPNVGDLPYDPSSNHPLVVPGSLYLVDSSFKSWRFPGWEAGIPTTVPNLVDGSIVTIQNNVVGGVVERTSKGALHVAPPRNANQTMFLAMQSQAVYDYVVANKGHAFYMASSARVTRNATIVNPAGATGRWLGWIGTSGTERGSIHAANSDMTVMSPYQEAGTPTNRQAGTNLVTTGVQLIDGEVTWTSDIGTSLAVSMFHGLNAAGAGSSHIQYFDYVEDLTVSGRTYAQAHAAVQAYHTAIHGVGGAFNGDTWTTPTV